MAWNFWSLKQNSLFNLVSHQPDVDKISQYLKDPHEARYQLLIESVGLNYFNNLKAFIEYSNDTDDIFENTDECYPVENKILIVFDDIIADM